MPTINGKACVLDGNPVDKVYSNGRQIYGRNLVTNSAQMFSKTTSAGGNTVISTNYLLSGGLSLYQLGINEGDWLTFSYDFNLEATSDLEPFTDGMFVQWAAAPWGMWESDLQKQSYIDTVISGGTPETSVLFKDNGVAVKVQCAGSGRVSVHIPMPNVSQRDINQLNFRLDAQEGKLTVGKIKMERGRLGTPWTPAPEDVM